MQDGDAGGAAAPRVLLACEWFVKYTAGLTRGLADAGCDVTLLTRDHSLEFGADPTAMRAGDPTAMREFIAATLDGRGRHLELSGRVRDLDRLVEVTRLRRRLASWSPDFVHLQESISSDLRLAFAAGLPGQSYSMTVHDPIPHPGEDSPARWRQPGQRTLRRRAGLLFVHSRALAEELEATGDARAPIEVVPHGFGTSLPAPLPKCPALLFFGRITHYKGLDTLLDAMPGVWRHNPEVTLTVAGEGEVPPHPVLADERVELRLEHVPEAAVPGLFGDSTCVVLPYRQASQSGVGSLARQYGRALIVTAVGGLPELVGPETGRLVPPEDPTALAAAIVEVVGTPGLAAQLGAAARDSASEAGWDRVGALTLDAYRRHLS